MGTHQISVFGLGKLGCTMMACFAHKGWNVVGVDVNQNNVDKINAGESPIYEPGVAELIQQNKSRIEATTDPLYAVDRTQVSFIIVPTPSIKDGSFSIEYVERVAISIAKAMQRGDPYRLIVVTSTVLPGDMLKICRKIEEISGKKCSEDFGLCYNPDFIALGKIIKDFLNPDMILIGESDKKAGDILEGIHSKLVDCHPSIHRMNWWNAELAKIALNSYCVMKINFANMLAEICERMPGGDAVAVAKAIGDDSRIGRKYFLPGLPAGGPCFPRDARAFSHSAARFNIKSPLSETIDKLNDYYKTYWIPTLIMEALREKKSERLAILGLTYKENTTLVEESSSIAVAKLLSRQGIRISVHDPVGMEEARRELVGSPDIFYASSIEECLSGASVCFVATPWPAYKSLIPSNFLNSMNPDPIILDAWNLYPSFKNDIDCRSVGLAH